jgi:hypothetical protein
MRNGNVAPPSHRPTTARRATRATRACRALLGGLALLAVLATPASARADAVTDWNQTATAALQTPGTAVPPGAGQGAPSTVHLAMVHAAVYDAVNAIAGCHEPYVSAPAAKRWYSQEAAVAAAAHHVLVNGGLGIPAARMPVIEAAYKATLLPIPDGPAKAGGIATGVAAAADMLAARAGDGRFGPFRFSESTLPGGWRLVPPATVTDPGAWLKDVTPFVLRDPDLFRGRAPHHLGSRAYAADFNEVKEIGSANSTTRTADQTAAAEYWGLTNATATMASIIRSVASTQGGTLADHARLWFVRQPPCAGTLARPAVGADRRPDRSFSSTWVGRGRAAQHGRTCARRSSWGGGGRTMAEAGRFVEMERPSWARSSAEYLTVT